MHHLHGKPYLSLAIMGVLSFASMYLLMYAMVDRFANVYSSLNQVYMAGLMTAPMIAIEIALMGRMYPSARTNLAIAAGSAVALAAFFLMIRGQTAISDREFLASMIPHHAGAILMCSKAPIEDAEIGTLCRGILAGQQAEIDWMKKKLAAEGGSAGPPPGAN